MLDGWWPKTYDGTNSAALEGDVDPDPAAQDARDADALYRDVGAGEKLTPLRRLRFDPPGTVAEASGVM